MKSAKTILLILIPFVLVSAQGMRNRMQDPEAMERIEQLENAKLIKFLDLKEDEAIRFFAKRKDYRQKMHELLQNRRELVETVEKLIKEEEKSNQKIYRDKIDEIFELESQIYKEKRNYYKAIAGIISPKQILQLMNFEERFRREVREKLMNRQYNRSEK